MKSQIVECKCGCGIKFDKFDKYRREREYIIGHGRRKRKDLRLPNEDNQMMFCACGCGKKFLKYDESGRPRVRIPHHSNKTLIEKFSRNINVTPFCWEWTGSKTKAGYGRIFHEKKSHFAHRFSYKFYIGDVLDDIEVCHYCDNPSCVNPQHLFLGTHLDNMHDSFRKGRLKGTPLTDDDVRMIRFLHRNTRKKYKETALKYGIAAAYVSKIVNYKQRRNVI